MSPDNNSKKAADLAIKATGLGRRYGRSWALSHIDLEVPAGESLLLVGANGSGKTTLLRLLAGTSMATAGELEIFGFDRTRNRLECRRLVSMVSHENYLYDRLTAYETVRLWARLLGYEPSDELVLASLDEVALAERAHDATMTFSAGMKKTPHSGSDQARDAPRGAARRADGGTRCRRQGAGLSLDRRPPQLRSHRGLLVALSLPGPSGRRSHPAPGARPGAVAGPPRGVLRATAAGDRCIMSKDIKQELAELPRSSFLHQVSTLVRKDLLLEWRSRSRFLSVLLFGVVTLVLFSFAVGPDTTTMRDIAGGFLILGLLLSSTLGLSESFRNEQQHRAFEGLTLLPVDAIALFYGKAISNTLFLLMLGPILIPVAIVLYSVELSLTSLGMLFLLWGLAAAGLSAPGTLYAAMTSRVESQDVLLPVLLFPLVTPLLLAAVKAAGLILDGDPMTQLRSWFIMLLAFNGIFWSLAGILFPFLDAEGL